MEKISENEYAGEFKTEFSITPKTKNFLESNNVNYEEFLPDTFHWYERELFEMIDENDDGKPDEKFGKNFKVVYYGIIEKATENEQEGFSDKVDYDEEKLVGNWTIVVAETKEHKSFGLKYLILRV